MTRRSVWTKLPADAGATHWRVKCNLCGFEEVKASPRNVQLCMRGHGKRHTDLPVDFTVTPLRREAGGR